MAGNKFDAAIIRGVTMKYKILIGEKTAEQAKKEKSGSDTGYFDDGTASAGCKRRESKRNPWEICMVSGRGFSV